MVTLYCNRINNNRMSIRFACLIDQNWAPIYFSVFHNFGRAIVNKVMNNQSGRREEDKDEAIHKSGSIVNALTNCDR